MKRLALIGFLLLSQWAMAQAVTFSAPGGFYDQPFELTLHCNDGFQIRYTTNGGEPTATSHLYQGNLQLDERLYSESKAYTIVNTIPSLFRSVDDVEHAIVIRAAAFDANGTRVSQVVTREAVTLMDCPWFPLLPIRWPCSITRRAFSSQVFITMSPIPSIRAISIRRGAIGNVRSTSSFMKPTIAASISFVDCARMAELRAFTNRKA